MGAVLERVVFLGYFSVIFCDKSLVNIPPPNKNYIYTVCGSQLINYLLFTGGGYLHLLD